MFESSGRSGGMARPKMDGAPESWQVSLASFGVAIGLVIFIYLLCRCCRYMNSVENPQERREDLNEPILGDGARANGVLRCTAVFMPPSAEAEPQYYSRR